MSKVDKTFTHSICPFLERKDQKEQQERTIPSIPFFLKNGKQFMKHLKQDRSSYEHLKFFLSFI